MNNIMVSTNVSNLKYIYIYIYIIKRVFLTSTLRVFVNRSFYEEKKRKTFVEIVTI